ncbi:hypothetical protein SAMN06265365_11719 [Tistlia consotensis]|uniref:Alpha/beta hydrolase family protein n=2 Tax=Tistlia TaxID=1321364 RepID=A0A1Y6CAM2_9PROT|nr:hypothetical protein SAMN05428998_118100 [Tistlia consotensis USBA 355]SNR83219.1 hypothetical protein SAMN06265365_11719 [Tistlia consotensis]
MLTCRWPDGETPKALVVFCHGLGASGRGYDALSGYWAARGYLVVHPTFPDWIAAVAAREPGLGLDPDADLSGWAAMPRVRARLHEILHTPFYWLERIRIVRRLLDEADAILAATGGDPGRPVPLAVAGHSFGAYTAQLLAGAEIDLPGESPARFRDDRLAAAILLSAQGRDQQGLRDGSWEAMTGPVLTVTGTLDRGAGGQGWEWKSEPYELGPPGGKYLAVLEGADHYLGGFASGGAGAAVPNQRDAVRRLTLAFLDAHVARDAAAASWLASITDRIGPAPLLFKPK